MIEMMADLTALVKRVEEAPEGDMELDADIWLFGVKEGRIEWAQTRYTMEAYPVWVYPSTNHLSGFGKEPVPRLTSSLDAAVAFVVRVRPGTEWAISMLYGHPQADVDMNSDEPTTARAATPALALVLAALRALSAAGDEDRRA